MNRNNVRGPTSALTEFLRESGITPTTVARRNAATQPEAQPVAGPSNSQQIDVGTNADANNEDSSASSRRRRTRVSGASGYASDDLDERAQERPVTKKRARASDQAKEKENAKKKAKKDDNSDSDEGAYTALSKSMWTDTASSKPPVGSFEHCAKCKVEFTVTRYTLAAVPGPGFLCHKCAKASGADPFKKPAPPRKRKAPADKRTVVHFEERRFPSLVSLCVQLISRHINDVEALGDIGAVNMTEISKAISKNRSLTPENALLFYGAQNTDLTFFDATNLKSAAFSTLASLNPNLTSLRIDFCGCIDDNAIAAWCTALPSLTRLELLGPFLIRAPAWISFFISHPQLEGFLITQSPRFDFECIQALVANCKGLKDIRLRQINQMEDAFVTCLNELKSTLRSLDLSCPGESLSENMLIELMKTVGPYLTHLDLSEHSLITDGFLHKGIKPYAQSLRSLALASIPNLTDQGVARFFDTWLKNPKTQKANPRLIFLDLSRNHQLSSEALTAVLAHSGPTLQHLNINSWRSASEDALNQIAKSAKCLRSLDVGWCREVNDFVIKELMTECESIKEVKVWGCNRLTEHCPRKRSVNIYGIEAHTVLRNHS